MRYLSNKPLAPLIHRVPLLDEVNDWNPEATRFASFVHIDANHSTRRGKPLIHRHKLIKLLCPKLKLDLLSKATYLINRPPTKKSHNQRLWAERTKHDRDPAVII
jgi:hypothetical protein